jgi:histidyl-tRNA synthetase
MQALGVPRFTIRFNTRRLLNGLAELVGCTAQAKYLFRIIDKVDRISVEGVLTELQREPDNQYDEAALALKGDQLARVREFLELRDVATTETLSRLSVLFAGNSSPSAAAGITEMTTMVELLRQLAIPENFWTLDLSVARGLDYYTGPVFETFLDDLPSLGSVIAGGRFDGLTNRFIPDSNISGVGASVGIDRLVNGLRDLKLLTGTNTVTQVLITIFGPEFRQQSLLLSQQLRLSGLNTELYLGEDSTLRAQMAYAAKQGIPFAVVIGPDETRHEVVQLKNMRQRTQEFVSREICAEKIKSAL